jgi:hypothetical protein
MSVTVDEVREAATRLFRTRQAADGFLALRCPALGDTPLELVRQGRGAEVLAFIENLEKVAPAPERTLGRMFSGWLGPFGGRR